jgi:hypothetical protein
MIRAARGFRTRGTTPHHGFVLHLALFSSQIETSSAARERKERKRKTQEAGSSLFFS